MHSQAPQAFPRMLAAGEIIPTIQRIIAERKEVRDLVARNVTPDTAMFANVIQPWLDEENRNQGMEAVIDMFRYAGSTQEIREIAEEATKLMSESMAELALRHDLFLLVKAVDKRNEDIDDECKKAVRDILREYTNVGHDNLLPEQMKILLEARKEIAQLCQAFNRNLREKTKTIRFTRTDLDGIPEQELERLEKAGAGHIDIDLGNRADRLLVLRNTHSEATRKKLYLENEHKLFENIPLFKRVVLLRDQNARLLGFKSHAQFKLQDRIATSTRLVDDMLETLREKVLPLGQRVVGQMKAIKRTRLHLDHRSEYVEILPWDYFYYLRLLEEQREVDQELISEYFPLHNAILRMLDLFASFLQLRFQPIAPKDLIDRLWHHEVAAWSVWDERPGSKGDFIGYLFSDVLYRIGKYKGNQNVNLQASYIAPEGVRVFPATILMCNFSPSTATGCALLRHSEVVTLFHELGHGIHDLLSRTLYTRYHAWRGPVEFGEALSTMLENWCWDETVLKDMSCHFSTLGNEYLEKWKSQHQESSPVSKQIPDKLLKGLTENRNLNRITLLLRQIADSLFDMAVHNPDSQSSLAGLDETELHNNKLEELTLRKNPDPSTWGPSHCHFGHLMSGYDAGYFAYLSAQVFAADFYKSAFTTDPQSQKIWERYRKIILEPGNSRDPLKMMEEFLGHTPRPDALVQNICFT